MELCLFRFPDDRSHVFGVGRDGARVLQLGALCQVDAVDRVDWTEAFNWLPTAAIHALSVNKVSAVIACPCRYSVSINC
jgi:hypothetical protein